jgi:hypothetical protein
MSNPLEDLLSGVLGGRSGGSSGGSNLLGSLLGGALPQGLPAPQQMGGIGNVLQMVMNGGGNSAASNQFLGPLVGSLGSKLNMSPNVSEQVISFAMQHLVSGHLSGLSNSSHADLMSHIASGKITNDFLQQTGLPQQLAQQANIDPKVATDGLKHVLEHFGQHMK